MSGKNRTKRSSGKSERKISPQGATTPAIVVRASYPVLGPKSTFDPQKLKRNAPVSARDAVNLHAASTGHRVLTRQEQTLRVGAG